MWYIITLIIFVFIGSQGLFLIDVTFWGVGAVFGFLFWFLFAVIVYNSSKEREYKDEVKRAAEKINKEE